MKHEIPAILKNGGAIVNTSSVVGQIGMPGSGVYTASKRVFGQRCRFQRGISRDALADLGQLREKESTTLLHSFRNP